MAIVDLAAFKKYMRIENDLEDGVAQDFLRAAESAAMNWCRVGFDETAEQDVKLAVMMYAGYNYEHRSEPDEKGYAAMYSAFKAMLSPYADPEKMI